MHIVVSGLNPGQAVTVGLRSADATGAVWTAQAVFRPDQSGTVDLATVPAVSGSYRGVDPMGLVELAGFPQGAPCTTGTSASRSGSRSP